MLESIRRQSARAIAVSLVLLLASVSRAATPVAGTVPAGADAKPLNLGFEDGTLKDWTATGNAFAGQPVEGDTVTARGRAGMKSNHAGDYWVGTYEVSKSDKEKGTLSSVPFKVTQPWGSFLVGGGASHETRVEIVTADDKKVIFTASGQERENLARVAVDLKAVVGKEIFIRVVDNATGAWGHINFDDFRFHETQPQIAPPAKVAGGKAAGPELTSDAVKNAGLTADEAVKAMTLPPGFKATVFAAEPDVMQPVAFCIDDRGRLWVAQAMNYPKKAPEGKGLDSIIIFEDSKGTGHFDKRTVFMEGLNLVSGIEVGFGGVWVGQAPQLLFIPILEGDKPGKPEVLLDGFAFNDTHETLNSFNWGPDGWLYGCHGVFNSSKVGKPGTPEKERTPMTAAVWRFHPTRKTFEIFAEGGSNQWGIDWDEHGQLFMTCCVIPHLYHVIQGGRYVRQAGPHTDPYTFADIKTIADHLHWNTGAANQWAANNKSDATGGGHAHAGAMIYLGDNFPEEYRGKIFVGNIHGNRINTDILEPQGSGFVGHHGKDFLLMNDKWSRLISMKYGPDGGVYVIDWYDKQACHLPKPEVWDRSNGRIYKITYGEPKPVKVDLAKGSDLQLCTMATGPNEWARRHALRLLRERVAGNPQKALQILTQSLGVIMPPANEPLADLRSAWAISAIMPFETQVAEDFLGKGEDIVGGWTIQLAADTGEISGKLAARIGKLASSTSSPILRKYIASAVPKLPLGHAWDVAATLASHAEDATDANLPLLYWYAIEPLVQTDVNRAAKLAVEAKIPVVREFIARRLAMGNFKTPVSATLIPLPLARAEARDERPAASDPLLPHGLKEEAAPPSDAAAMAAVVDALGQTTDSAVQTDILKGITDGLAGKRSAPMPASWAATYEVLAKSADAGVRQRADALATVFGDAGALSKLRKTLADAKADPAKRQDALDTLLAAKDAKLPAILQSLLSDATVRGAAIRGLAAYDDAKTPQLLLDVYPSLTPTEKRDALNTLAARPASAQILLASLKIGAIPKGDLTAPTIRNLSSLDDAAVNAWIADNWGTVRATAEDKVKEIARLRRLLNPDIIAKADRSSGRALFAKTCQQCHTLFDAGAKIGPDLTGSNRADVSYLLENIVDPSAVIGKDYLLTMVKTTDGRLIDGIIKSQTDSSLTIATTTETITLPKSEIKSTKVSSVSMMPEGLLAGMNDKEVRELIAYLASQKQVAPPAEAAPAKSDKAQSLFDGKTLDGWEQLDPPLWRVEDACLTGGDGKAKIPYNDFLCTKKSYSNFVLHLKIKLIGDPKTGFINSGVQIRTHRNPAGHEVCGYQCDYGEPDWYGAIYDEGRRNRLMMKSDIDAIRPTFHLWDWNDYVIKADGSRIQTWVNGVQGVDFTEPDPDIASDGIIGLQVHGGGNSLVQVKDVWIEELPPTPNVPTWESLGGVAGQKAKLKPAPKPAAAK